MKGGRFVLSFDSLEALVGQPFLMSVMKTLEVLQCHCALLWATTLLQPLITHLRENREWHIAVKVSTSNFSLTPSLHPPSLLPHFVSPSPFSLPTMLLPKMLPFPLCTVPFPLSPSSLLCTLLFLNSPSFFSHVSCPTLGSVFR